ncbi:unnamed protein product [Lasius platythorax]|uniref:Uncharacterized protein n=1 Tax=Lasius platythorax TaxID=488582 RepID=A0AAV2P3A2_9HYME
MEAGKVRREMSNSFHPQIPTDRETSRRCTGYNTSWHSRHNSSPLACFIEKFARGLERLTWITAATELLSNTSNSPHPQLSTLCYTALYAPRGAKDTESITIPLLAAPERTV